MPNGLYAALAQVDPYVQGDELTASDGAAKDNFGISVALSANGRTALVGARSKAVGSNSAQGAAYVFTVSGATWTQGDELTASDGAASDYFGSVALSANGSTALVGADYKTVGGNKKQGAAYVFTVSGATWTQQAKLTARDGAADDCFGDAVALSDDGSTALVGAADKTVGGDSGQGAAYMFTVSGSHWTQRAKLTASDGTAGGSFGSAVALSSDGSTALVTAPYKTVNGHSQQGVAYVFTANGNRWTQQAKLTARDGAAGDRFGDSVALSSDGSTALLGAPGKAVDGSLQQGEAYVFSGSKWTQQAEVTTSDGAADDSFGISVALSANGSTALVGANLATVGSNYQQGAAYVFTVSGSRWAQGDELTTSDGAVQITFGDSVALSADGSTALVGAGAKTVGGNRAQGAAYVFVAPVPTATP